MNELGRATTDFTYDAWDNLVSGTYNDKSGAETIYKAPDAIGNLFKTPERKDRQYDKGGKLLKDDKYYYHYDAEGNLIFKEFITSGQPNIFDRKELQKRLDIKLKGAGIGWLYEWSGNGMLNSVTLPQGSKVSFAYDPLGRRIKKETKDKIFRYLWDSNVLLHEWEYLKEDGPKTIVTDEGKITEDKPEPTDNVITWVYENGSFVPCAKIVNNEYYSIVSDYIGRPTHCYNNDGVLVWETEYDVYGKLRNTKGDKFFIKHRQLGQYEDAELDGLYYNRYRMYDSNSGIYLTQDPIGLSGGMALYAYVHDANLWVDILGWHGNELGNIADSQLYDIKINGTRFKYGIATEKFVTKTDISVIRPNGSTTIIPAGTPTRLKDQLRKAYSNYDDVEVKTKRYPQISTGDMRDIETKAIRAHVDATGKVPSGNKAHAHLGPLADDFNGVHDLKKDLKMKKNVHH